MKDMINNSIYSRFHLFPESGRFSFQKMDEASAISGLGGPEQTPQPAPLLDRSVRNTPLSSLTALKSSAIMPSKEEVEVKNQLALPTPSKSSKVSQIGFNPRQRSSSRKEYQKTSEINSGSKNEKIKIDIAAESYLAEMAGTKLVKQKFINNRSQNTPKFGENSQLKKERSCQQLDRVIPYVPYSNRSWINLNDGTNSRVGTDIIITPRNIDSKEEEFKKMLNRHTDPIINLDNKKSEKSVKKHVTFEDEVPVLDLDAADLESTADNKNNEDTDKVHENCSEITFSRNKFDENRKNDCPVDKNMDLMIDSLRKECVSKSPMSPFKINFSIESKPSECQCEKGEQLCSQNSSSNLTNMFVSSSNSAFSLRIPLTSRKMDDTEEQNNDNSYKYREIKSARIMSSNCSERAFKKPLIERTKGTVNDNSRNSMNTPPTGIISGEDRPKVCEIVSASNSPVENVIAIANDNSVQSIKVKEVTCNSFSSISMLSNTDHSIKIGTPMDDNNNNSILDYGVKSDIFEEVGAELYEDMSRKMDLFNSKYVSELANGKSNTISLIDDNNNDNNDNNNNQTRSLLREELDDHDEFKSFKFDEILDQSKSPIFPLNLSSLNNSLSNNSYLNYIGRNENDEEEFIGDQKSDKDVSYAKICTIKPNDEHLKSVTSESNVENVNVCEDKDINNTNISKSVNAINKSSAEKKKALKVNKKRSKLKKKKVKVKNKNKNKIKNNNDNNKLEEDNDNTMNATEELQSRVKDIDQVLSAIQQNSIELKNSKSVLDSEPKEEEEEDKNCCGEGLSDTMKSLLSSEDRRATFYSSCTDNECNEGSSFDSDFDIENYSDCSASYHHSTSKNFESDYIPVVPKLKGIFGNSNNNNTTDNCHIAAVNVGEDRKVVIYQKDDKENINPQLANGRNTHDNISEHDNDKKTHHRVYTDTIFNSSPVLTARRLNLEGGDEHKPQEEPAKKDKRVSFSGVDHFYPSERMLDITSDCVESTKDAPGEKTHPFDLEAIESEFVNCPSVEGSQMYSRYCGGVHSSNCNSTTHASMMDENMEHMEHMFANNGISSVIDEAEEEENKGNSRNACLRDLKEVTPRRDCCSSSGVREYTSVVSAYNMCEESGSPLLRASRPVEEMSVAELVLQNAIHDRDETARDISEKIDGVYRQVVL